jgi:hypothetical protein
MVLVTWNDAHCAIGYPDDADKEHSPKLTYSVGFLIRKNAKGVTIAQDCYAEGKDYHTWTFIPKGMVVSVVKVLENLG